MTVCTTNTIYNFSGTAGTVTENSSFTVAGINWLTSGYTWSANSIRTLTGTDQTSTGTNTIFIANTRSGLKPVTNVKGLSELKGKRFTFGSESSTSGRLMPQYFLAKAGVKPL